MTSRIQILASLFLAGFAVLQISVVSQAKDPDVKADDAIPKVKQLYQSWTHSREENDPKTPGVEVYRPTASREFPRSRFRGHYVFRADGSCEWLQLAPNDAHEVQMGKWSFDAKNPRVLHVYPKQGDKPVVSWTIIELTDKVLKVKPL